MSVSAPLCTPCPTWKIDPDIARAETLPSEVYTDERWLAAARRRVFARSWQYVADADALRTPGQALPVTLGEGLVDEPLVLTRDRGDQLHCLSNVCTHRGALVCDGAGVHNVLRCRYHGRRFGLDGRMLSMPEFEGVEGFPSAADDLPPLPCERWGKLLFTALDPELPAAVPFAEWIGPLEERAGWLPLEEAVFDAGRSRDYLVAANWALYCTTTWRGSTSPTSTPPWPRRWTTATTPPSCSLGRASKWRRQAEGRRSSPHPPGTRTRASPSPPGTSGCSPT